MAYISIPAEDFVVSSEAVASATWTGGAPTLTQLYTSSIQEAGASGDYYLNVFQTASGVSTAEVQFAVTYGNKYGYGSPYYNNAVSGSTPTKTTYGQYRTLINGDENTDFTFGATGTNNQYTSTEFWAINIDRNRYRESLLPGSWTLRLSGSRGLFNLTDDSLVTNTVTFKDAGRVYQIISGSNGVRYTGSNAYGYVNGSGSYGWFLPDIGVLLLNPSAVSQSIGVASSQSVNSDGLNYQKIFEAIKSGNSAVPAFNSSYFSMNSQETISADYIFIRARNAQFNYTENPSFTNASTGEVNYPIFINNPQTYITTIGLYNDAGDLLAVAKMSRPLPKDFTKEALVRVKLDF